MHNSRNRIAHLGVLLAASLAGSMAAEIEAFQRITSTPVIADINFPSRRFHGATNNGGHGRGNAARFKRLAKKRKNVRARSSKRRTGGA